MLTALERFSSGWLTELNSDFVWLAGYHNSLDFMRDREWPGKQTLARRCELIQNHRQWMSFVANILRFSLNHCKETRVEILIMTSETVIQWWILQERNSANAFRIGFDANATSCDIEFSFFPGFLSARGTAVQPGLLFIVYGNCKCTGNILG